MIFGINNDWFSIKRNLERFGYCWTHASKHGFNQLVAHWQRQVLPLRSVPPRLSLPGKRIGIPFPNLIRLFHKSGAIIHPAIRNDIIHPTMQRDTRYDIPKSIAIVLTVTFHAQMPECVATARRMLRMAQDNFPYDQSRI